MNIRLELVPRWRHAWKWFSVQAAVLTTILALIEAGAKNAQDNPLFAWLVAMPWFPYVIPVVALLGAILRLVHQPVEESTSTESEPMNSNIARILQAIPALVVNAEEAFKDTPGSGVDKAAAVTGIVAELIPPGDSIGIAKAKAVMQMAVAFYNMVHPMFQKTPQQSMQPTIPPKV